MELKEYPAEFGTITHIRLTNAAGASATLSTLGAGIVSIVVPDSEGNMADVVLGYENPADWMNDGPCAGKIPGRYANRIARGHFSLDGKDYSLAVNCGPNHLHGGPTGFQNRIWELVEADDGHVEMEYVSADGEEGYPGDLTVRARYTWTDDCELRLGIRASVTGKATVINLTNHAYVNLGGHDSGTALNHILQLNASRWLKTDSSLAPTGEFAPVEGTPMDFTAPKAVGRDIKADFEPLHIGKGYDHCFVIDSPADGRMRPVATLYDPVSGRRMEVATTQPGVQLYSANWLDGCPAGKDGAVYADYDAVAIECQALPDSPNQPAFPSAVLRPGEEYGQTISYKFTTK